MNISVEASSGNVTSIYDRHPEELLLKKFIPDVYYVKLYVSPIWFIVGLLGNAITFFIWASNQQRKKNSSAVYLAALALSDFFLISFLLSKYLQENFFINISIAYNGICQIYQGLFLFLQYYSIVLIFGFTLERWIAICYPLKRCELCTTRRALIGVLILALCVACSIVVYAASWEVSKNECIWGTKWRISTSFRIYYNLTEGVYSLLVPVITLIFNILVLRQIHAIKPTGLHTSTSIRSALQKQVKSIEMQAASQLYAQSSLKTNRSLYRREHNAFKSVTVMLVTLSFYLILCTLPVSFMYLLQQLYVDAPEHITDEEVLRNEKWNAYFRYRRVKKIIDLLCSSHYACNFIIYIITCRSFREQFFHIFTFKKTRY